MKTSVYILLLVAFCQITSAKTLLVPQVGHSEPVSHVSFSPSGRFLSSSSDDMSVRVWAMDGNAVALLEGHKTPVVQSVFLSDKYLLSVGRGGLVYGWDILSQEKSKVADFDGIAPILGTDLIGLARDNSHIAIAGFRSFHWARMDESWTPDTPLNFKEVRVNFNLHGLAVSPSGRFIAAVNNTGYLYLYDTFKEAELVRQILEPMFTRLTFVDDRRLALAGRDVSLFDVQAQKIVDTISGESVTPISALAVNPESGALTVIADELRSISADGRTVIFTADGVAPATAAYSPDGEYLAVVDQKVEACRAEGTQIRILDSQGREFLRIASGFNAQPKTALLKNDLLAISACTHQIQLWDLENYVLKRSLKNLDSPVQHMTVDASSDALLFMGNDHSLKRWHQNSAEKRIDRVWDNLKVTNLDFSTVIGQVAYTESSGQDTEQVFVDFLERNGQRRVLPKTFTASIDDIRFSPSGGLLTVHTEHDGILAFGALLNVPEADGETDITHSVGRMGSFGSLIVDYAFNPVSERVVIAYEDRVELWSTQSFTKMNVKPARYAGIQKIRFSEDGSKFALVAFRKVLIFNALDLKMVDELDGVAATDVYFVNDDQHLAVISRDARIEVYDTGDGFTKLATIQNINDQYGYAFDSDGNVLSVASTKVFQPLMLKTVTSEKIQLDVLPQSEVP